MEGLKKFKIRTIVILAIIFVFLAGIVAGGCYVYKNKNTALALYYLATDRVNVLEQNKLNTDEKALNTIKEFGVEEVRPLTEEETKKLATGELTEEEAIDLVLGKEEPEDTGESGNPAESSSPPSQSGGTTSGDASAANEEIAELIGKLYVLKAKFTSDLEGIQSWVSEKYFEYTEEYGEGNIPTTIKTKVGKQAYADALALEAQCDTEVNAILNRITTLLTETGQSTTLVDEIKTAYENEKALAKAKYMSQI